jgi:hypothetical protein
MWLTAEHRALSCISKPAFDGRCPSPRLRCSALKCPIFYLRAPYGNQGKMVKKGNQVNANSWRPWRSLRGKITHNADTTGPPICRHTVHKKICSPPAIPNFNIKHWAITPFPSAAVLQKAPFVGSSISGSKKQAGFGIGNPRKI